MCEVVSKTLLLKNNNIVFPKKNIVFPKNPLFSNMCTFYPIVLKRKIITAQNYISFPFISLIILCLNGI